MICPQCKAEYVDGVTHCSDCGVDLVDSLPAPGAESAGSLSDADLRGVWGGQDQEEFAAVCAQLKDAGIPFRVNERGREFLTGLGQYFEIGVPAVSYDRAREIIYKDRLDPFDENVDSSVMELPAEDDEPAPAESDDEWDSKDWFPEDATAEIWSGKSENQASMVESSLRENNIRARTDGADGGLRRIFVIPSDASRAKEIVREIDEATPPK
ncbi:MAG: hypothetical protein WBF06_03410 [Candidatus Acidiferrales bacterium]